MKVLGWDDSRENPYIITPWTLIHIMTGIVSGVIFLIFKIKFYYAVVIYFIIHGVYEIKDYIGTHYKINGEIKLDNSVANSIADQFFSVLAFSLTYYYKYYFLNKAKNVFIAWVIMFITYIYISSFGCTINWG
jgi:hypothetical protein